MESEQTSLAVAPGAPPSCFAINGEQLTSFIRTKLCPLAGVRSVRLNDQPASPKGELRDHVVSGGSLVVQVSPPKTPAALADLCAELGHRLRCVGAVQISAEAGEFDYAVVAENGCPSHLIATSLLRSHSRAYIELCAAGGWSINPAPVKQKA